MPLFMEGRLKTILIIFIFIFSVYIIEGIVLNAEDSLDRAGQFDESDFDKYAPKIAGYTEEEWRIIGEERGYSDAEIDASISVLKAHFGYDQPDLLSIVGDFFSFMTFQEIDMPLGALLILNFIMAIVFIVGAYIIASFIYDIIKALPFT